MNVQFIALKAPKKSNFDPTVEANNLLQFIKTKKKYFINQWPKLNINFEIDASKVFINQPFKNWLLIQTFCCCESIWFSVSLETSSFQLSMQGRFLMFYAHYSQSCIYGHMSM